MNRTHDDLFRKLNVLFLAKHAPQEGASHPEFHPEDGVVPIYHYEIYSILKELGFNVYSSNDLNVLFSDDLEVDYVFSLYNRAPFRNSEVFVSAMCEYLKLPYLGAPPNIRIIAEDKHVTKLLASHLDIPTSPWEIYRTTDKRIKPPAFTGPYFIKPRFGAASEHISENSIIESWCETESLINKFLSNGIDIILEKCIDGIIVTIPAISFDENITFPCIKNTSTKKRNVMTYKQKRLIEEGLKREVMEENETTHIIRNHAKRLGESMQPLDYARFDFIVDKTSKTPCFLEVNICSNLGSHSSIALSAKSIGMSQKELVSLILTSSFERQKLLGK